MYNNMSMLIKYNNGYFRGVSRALDLGARVSRNQFAHMINRSDNEAIREDWERVGCDMYSAINVVSNDIECNPTERKA
jgi:hypothetical protein